METSTAATMSWYQFVTGNQSPLTDMTTVTTEPSLGAAGQKSFDFGLLFRSVIIIIGLVGALANATVLIALAASKDLKKELFNVLFVNQMSFDLYSSIILVVTFFMKIFPVRLTGTLGYWVCVLVYGETILWIGLNGSMLNLAAITVERYVKIVFPIWYKTKFRPWMVYCFPIQSNLCRPCAAFHKLSKRINRDHDSGITLSVSSCLLCSKCGICQQASSCRVTFTEACWLMTKASLCFEHAAGCGSWMVYSTVVFTWVTAAAINITVSFPTTAVVNGYCWSWSFWPSKAVKLTYSVLYFIFYFFNLVVIFIYCYSHIMAVVRRQARVMQSHQQHEATTSAHASS